MTGVNTRELAQHRRVLFTILTVLSFRHPPGQEPALVAGARQWPGGWPGIGRIVAGMARRQRRVITAVAFRGLSSPETRPGRRRSTPLHQG